MTPDDDEAAAPRLDDGVRIQTDRFPLDTRPRRSKDEILEHLEEVVNRLRAQTIEMEHLIAEARSQLPRQGPTGHQS